MNRRAFLVTAGTACAAGCVGDATSPAAGSDTSTGTNTSSSDDTTPTPLDPAAVLSVETLGTGTVDPTGNSAGNTQRYVEVRVENTWDRPIGKVTVSADWLDSGGTVSATTSDWIYAFAPGDVWRAAVRSEPDVAVEGVDVTVDPQRQTIAPGPLSAADHHMAVADDATLVAGTVANSGDEDVFPTVFGKFFDETSTIAGRPPR